MARDKRRSDLHYFLLGVGSLMDIAGNSTRHVHHRPRRRYRRRNTTETIAGYWATVGRYLSEAIGSYPDPRTDRR